MPPRNTSAYTALRNRDRQRREQVQALQLEGKVQTAGDHYRAACIMQHGDTPDEALLAHEVALKASQLGFRPARWLAAAALDRHLMYAGQPQKYGTQFVDDGVRYRLWDIEPSTTDEERHAWDVPALTEQLRRAEELTEHHPPVPLGPDAPVWLLTAVKRWEKEAQE